MTLPIILRKLRCSVNLFVCSGHHAVRWCGCAQIFSLIHHASMAFGSYRTKLTQLLERIVSLSRPLDGIIVLNVDDSVCCSVSTWGFVNLIYDHRGDFLNDYYNSNGDLSIIHAEILFLFCGLQLCCDIGYKKVAYFFRRNSCVLILLRAI